ncbi:MAG: endo-1,4-beta-xylanase, partial [bacterium]
GMQQPEWIANLPPGEPRKEVEEWIKSFCQRYPKTAMIDVVNEPITHPPKQYKNALGGNGETGWDWVIWAFEKARLYAPDAILILNEHSILASDKKLERFAKIVKLLQKRKLIDAVGLQAHFLEIISPKDIERRLDKIAGLGLPIYISEFDLNIADDEAQKEKCKALFPIFWQHRAVKGITFWGYKEGRMWRKRGYLLREDGSERPTMTWLREYLQRQVQK